MARHFSDFLSAYFEFARDGFCPDRFHKWVGLSIIAAALERKVSLKDGRIHHSPNIYVMLVSHPAVGKSTAMGAGTGLIEAVKKKFNPDIKIIPNQITEPALIELMTLRSLVPLSATGGFYQSAGYFYASEASNSALQNIHGNFIASLTEFYDCPPIFRKKIKMEKEMVEIENGCINLLAGSTFNYLKTLVNESSSMGGFASRLMYVVQNERTVKETKWDSADSLDSRMAGKLVEDLAQINKMIGPMKPTAGWIARWEKWKPEFDKYLQELNSDRLEAIMSRKGTNLIKVSMLLSASESNSREITEEHFVRAQELIDDVYKDNPIIIASASMSDVSSQKGTTQLIGQTLKRVGGKMNRAELLKTAFKQGNNVQMVRETIEGMLNARLIGYEADSDSYTTIVDPDRYL